MIRIIGGKNRSRKLLTPKDETKTRPTKDMVRGAIFSAISDTINNAVTLDLFAGSGALSFEALSRGASKAYINDIDKEAIQVIKENAKNLNESPIILNKDYKYILESLSDVKFDVVFLDPPYAMDIYNEVIKSLLDKDLLSKDAVLVLESNRHLELDSEYPFNKIKEYKYGYTYVTILWR